MMIRRKGERKITGNHEMRGGTGTVTLVAALNADQGEFLDKGRLFSTITLPPGASIGLHTHEKEMEAFLILGGHGRYNDDGTEIEVGEGDVTYTAPGQSHAIANIGNDDLTLVALILFQ